MAGRTRGRRVETNGELRERRRVSGRRLLGLVRRFPRMRILVVGDFMLDQFIWGTVSRISPEAPVPIVRMTHEDRRAGGAGNVAANIRALGGEAEACGIVGRDGTARELLALLRQAGVGVSGMITAATAMTTTKTRIVAHQQQVVRLDREATGRLDARSTARLARHVIGRIDGCSGVIVSDYGKGSVTHDLLERLSARRAREAFLWVVDPKRPNFSGYRGPSLVKPNVQEASVASGIDITDLASLCRAGEGLLEAWGAEAVLVSRGEDGMSLFARGRRARHFPTAAREVFDVTGAGDTAISVCTLALAAGGSFEEAAVLANIAAGIAVGRVGTVAVGTGALLEGVRRAQEVGICAA